MIPKVLFVRGIPGSGKSFYANNTLARQLNCKVFEADDHMVNEEGEYSYNPQLIEQCHQLCREDAIKSLQEGAEHVIIANTGAMVRDYELYLAQFQEAFEKIDVQFYQTNYPGTSVHGVPEHAIARMRSKFLTNEELKNHFAPKYPNFRFFCLETR